ncbi:MAG: TOBE domain-containing protein, partial [Acidimicrobiaceae bacterium]|nr:TOBE domain-containing protein [Acidimicrobiaceae bacterium]
SELVARFVGHEAIIERDGQRFAVRPDAVALVPPGDRPADGSYAGTVTACAFQGDRYELLIDVDGQRWRVFSADSSVVGSQVKLILRPDMLSPLIG